MRCFENPDWQKAHNEKMKELKKGFFSPEVAAKRKESNARLKTNCFHNKELRDIARQKSIFVCREKAKTNKVIKKCLFCGSDMILTPHFAESRKFCNSSCFGKYNIRNQIDNKKGFWDVEKVKIRTIHSEETRKKLKIGFYNTINKIKAMIASKEAWRKNRNLKYNDIHFSSKLELYFAKKLHEILNIELIKKENCHIMIKSHEIDFFVFNEYVEIHNFNRKIGIDKWDNKRDDYINDRINILKTYNLYKNNFVLLESYKDMDNYILSKMELTKNARK